MVRILVTALIIGGVLGVITVLIKSRRKSLEGYFSLADAYLFCASGKWPAFLPVSSGKALAGHARQASLEGRFTSQLLMAGLRRENMLVSPLRMDDARAFVGRVNGQM
ncbi:hypothetical protein ABTZ58_18055 [Streptomyces sp. NPDC094143]|uniref:hypothetical protein n=1 Tax=Streptomyces sp. NPDC094143 TaxID=3155310 RepID=UPI00331C8650